MLHSTVMRALYLMLAVGLFFVERPAFAAANCTLDFPDRDVKRLVKESTTYRVRELIPFRHGKKDLRATLSRELGEELDAEYETSDTPYTFYAVYEKIEQVALILGLNARASDGPMQIFVVYDRKGKIRDVYVQKISSKDATHFRSKYYREQYTRYTINNIPGEADIKLPLRSPTTDTIRDHHVFLRSVRLNMLVVKYLYNQFKE
ncbi:MAG: hypothetical protein HY075_07330 [Deltaproteobacteria bacterium]|nr:hypothetical protein [Deltaproteobacteria bacterium]